MTRSVLVMLLAMVWSTGSADDISGDAGSDDALQPVKLEFNEAKAARVAGRLVGPDAHEYTFNARKGQTVVLELSSDLSAWIGMDLLAPTFAATIRTPAVYTNFIDGSTHWEGVAPGDGIYTVRLELLNSQARKVGRVDYQLEVDLK
jgi:hypothetical protein